MPFSWRLAKLRSDKAMFERYTIQATTNPDFQIAHVELTRELTNKQIFNKVETKKYIKSKISRTQKHAEIPKPSVIIKRLNRVVG